MQPLGEGARPSCPPPLYAPAMTPIIGRHQCNYHWQPRRTAASPVRLASLCSPDTVFVLIQSVNPVTVLHIVHYNSSQFWRSLLKVVKLFGLLRLALYQWQHSASKLRTGDGPVMDQLPHTNMPAVLNSRLLTNVATEKPRNKKSNPTQGHLTVNRQHNDMTCVAGAGN